METLKFLRDLFALTGIGLVFYGLMFTLAVGFCILFGRKETSENV
jgi:prolipoprotein diacylglyceryltransferase